MAKKKTACKHSPLNLPDWTSESLQETWKIIHDLAVNKYKLSFYDPHFEVVSFEDMLHIYTGSLPITYDHWSFGKAYEQYYKQYMNDRMGVAYEVIFNTSPALCYLLEHNSPAMQGLTMAHAACGHSAFFRNNVFFKEMTNASTIIPLLKKFRDFVKECEETHGVKEVESLLDACHALQLYSFDRRPQQEKTEKEKAAKKLQKALDKDRDYNVNADTIKINDVKTLNNTKARMREENILKFLGKYSPALKSWQRQIIDMYCKTQQYLYPQMLTKVMNEGFASFWHHTLMNDLIDMGLLESGGAIEFLHSHCSVLRQPNFDDKGYYGINPYKLGFEIFKDIRRICENPTEEDKEWFPGLVGKNWVEEVKFAAYNFKDESFILQYLSPKVMRDFKLFSIIDDSECDTYRVAEIHDDEGYKVIRRQLANSYNLMSKIPDVYVEGWDAKRTRKLYLCFQEKNGVQLESNTTGDSYKTLCLIEELWPFPIDFKYIDSEGIVIDVYKNRG